MPVMVIMPLMLKPSFDLLVVLMGPELLAARSCRTAVPHSVVVPLAPEQLVHLTVPAGAMDLLVVVVAPPSVLVPLTPERHVEPAVAVGVLKLLG